MQLPRMKVESALEVLASHRGPEAVVISNQGSARLWPRVSQHPLDFNYNPSTMGGAVPLGLGLALADAGREVLVLSGDGSLLMSLGSLVSVIDSGVENISILLLDNGLYEVTGGQRPPGALVGVDFAGIARSCGFANVAHFWDIDDWQRRIADVFAKRGPRFITLRVAAMETDCLGDKPESMAAQLERMRKGLATDRRR